MSLTAWYRNWHFRRPRSHQLTYRVQLQAARTDGWLLLPYPTSTEYQTVGPITLRAADTVQQHDFFYSIQQSSWAEWRCHVTVQPRQLNLTAAQPLTLADYGAHPDGEFYCQPDNWIQSQHPQIMQRAATYKKRASSVLELIEALYEHTIATLQYGAPIQDLYTTEQALARPVVDCGGFSTYLAALCRACQIPTRLISGFWAGHPHNEMHAWLECLLPNGQWLALDPSVDYLRRRGRTIKLGGFNSIGSDRIAMNTGSQHDLTIHGQNFTLGIIQTPLFLRTDGAVEHLRNYLVQTT